MGSLKNPFNPIDLTRVFFVGLLLLSAQQANGANILGLFTSHSPSHLILHMSVAKVLAEQGHNITVVSSMKPKETHPTIKHIIIPPTEALKVKMEKSMKRMATTPNSLLNTLKNFLEIVETQVDTLKDERFQKLYEEKFDLVILGYFMNDYQLGVAAKFKCPVIVDWVRSPIPMVNSLVGDPEEVAYVPVMNMAHIAVERMNFMQRLQNFLSAAVVQMAAMIMRYQMRGYYRELFPSEHFPTFDDMQRNVSLVFCNSHFSEEFVRPHVPAFVEIGGIHIKPKTDPLPQDIAEFLDAGKQDGAILFSMGTNLKGNHMRAENLQIIFKVLSNLKQKVIWKWEDYEHLPGKSSNILYKNWLPQDDVLAHPNLKLFVTHAGKGGIIESQYYGVPMVALPVFADQNENAEKMVLAGYGQQLDMHSLNEKDFKAAILEVLGNPKYKENVQLFSELYRDRPLSAKQSVAYWTDYVLRHHGAKHMQSPLVHLNKMQSLSLDVIGTLLVVAYVIMKVLSVCFIFILNKLFKRHQLVTRKPNQKAKKTKNQ